MRRNRRAQRNGRSFTRGLVAAALGLAAGLLLLSTASNAQQRGGNLQARSPLQNVFGQGSANNAPGGSFGTGNTMNGPNGTNTGPGGGNNADFQALIDLITTTVQPTTWVDGGGPGDIREFASGGVFVDTAGTLRLKEARPKAAGSDSLTVQRGTAPPSNLAAGGDPRRQTALRYVSLPRLEREIIRRQGAHDKLDVSMLTLAGLERVQYVFVYPDSGDVVLAGPAGDWRVDADGRIVSAKTGHPVVRLDDLLVLLRRGLGGGDSFFGCSINPRQEALASTQSYLDQTSKQAIEPSQRQAWLKKLRDTMGKQDIEIFGVDPKTRVAGVLVEADYHMKLIGMGLVPSVEGVPSYLTSIQLKNGESPPAMSVLRWWFTLNYDKVRSSAAGDAFELMGQGVRVLSESEMLAARGQRVHTGQSDPLNKLFADRFTAHFAQLADKYPIYADLRNIFDLSMAVALIESEGLAKRANWQPAVLMQAEKLRVPERSVPRQVETVINHRVIDGRHIVAGVSGGVMVAAKDAVRDGRATDNAGTLNASRRPAPAAVANTPGAWWWDASE